MKFQYSKQQPLTINNYDDKFIFLNNNEFKEYDNFLFENQPIIDGGVTYNSWNQLTLIIKYTENIWTELSKINYLKVIIDGAKDSQYYFITHYEIIGKNKISLTCDLDIWTTYQPLIKFKKNSSIFIDRMHANRWKSNKSSKIGNEYYLIPNWNENSFLWQPETKLQNMDNKIIENVYRSDLILPYDYSLFNTFLYKGEFIYFVFKYDTNTTTGESNYYPPFPQNQKTFTANPMPFFIIPVLLGELRVYTKFIDSPYLQGIYYSQIPWFDPTIRDPNHVFTDEEKKLNPIVTQQNWYKTYLETLPKEFDNIQHIIRADLIDSFLYNKGKEIYENFRENDILNTCGFIKDKDKFSPINEPKLYMYPFFELNYIKGKKQPLVIHNERLFSNIINTNSVNVIISILETFTPYYISSYRYISQGMYNTSKNDLKYSIDLSGTNNLLSLSSAYKTFLNSYLANYNTGLLQKKWNLGLSIPNTGLGLASSMASGAITGSIIPGVGSLLGAGVGALIGATNAIGHWNNTTTDLRQQENILVDLARQPDTINNNLNTDTYLELGLLRDVEYCGSLRTKELTDYNREQVAYFFHKFGYPFNKNLIVEKWQDLIIRDTWNYLQIENFIHCIDLDNSNIPWLALNFFNEVFKKGIRLWKVFDFKIENKLFNYMLPNWEIDIDWEPDGLEMTIKDSIDILSIPNINDILENDIIMLIGNDIEVIPKDGHIYKKDDIINIVCYNNDFIIKES